MKQPIVFIAGKIDNENIHIVNAVQDITDRFGGQVYIPDRNTPDKLAIEGSDVVFVLRHSNDSLFAKQINKEVVSNLLELIVVLRKMTGVP